ncbi:EexN family lipoprotein [Acidithiobacillus caldus]
MHYIVVGMIGESIKVTAPRPLSVEDIVQVRNVLISCTICLFLSGCSDNAGPYGAKSADWYEHHRAEDLKELSWCRNHGGLKEKIGACVNAQTGANWRYAKTKGDGVPSNLF